jgi:hypothetical protein
MALLNSVCDAHDHDPGLPDRDLRCHILAQAIRSTERELAAHGYADVGRGMEVLDAAIEDALDPNEREALLGSSGPSGLH